MAIDHATGSRYMINEWEYPDVGVVFAVTPAGGHVTFMLDYSEATDETEPTVILVDDNRIPMKVADSFEEFLNALRPAEDFETPL